MLIYKDPGEDLWAQYAEIRINTVNCVGVMGKGIALQFKQRYPNMFKEYQKVCNNKQLKPGGLWVWTNSDYTQIVNFATKDHWRDPSKYEWISAGLDQLSKYLQGCYEYDQFITIPPLGCGNGGLDWKKVKEMIENALNKSSHLIYVYQPYQT